MYRGTRYGVRYVQYGSGVPRYMLRTVSTGVHSYKHYQVLYVPGTTYKILRPTTYYVPVLQLLLYGRVSGTTYDALYHVGRSTE